jgi:hypothetical protein
MIVGEGHYLPYYHWFYQGSFTAVSNTDLPGPTATFGGTVGQSIQLIRRRFAYNPDNRKVSVDLAWQLTDPAPTDAKVFVHVYGPDGKLIEREGAQVDRRPGDDALPPANWLPGSVHDAYTLTMPEGLPPGKYRVAVGLYDPTTMQRFEAKGDGVESDNRLFIGEFELK